VVPHPSQSNINARQMQTNSPLSSLQRKGLINYFNLTFIV